MRKLLYIIAILFVISCEQDRLLQAEANINYLDLKLEENVTILEDEITSLEDDTAAFIVASELVASNVEDYANAQEAHTRDLTDFQNEIQQDHLNRFNSDLEAIRSILTAIEDTNNRLSTDLESLDNLRLQLEAARQDEIDQLVEEIYALEAEIDSTYIALEETLYDDFLSLTEETFTEISEIIGSIDGTQDVIELIIQQVIRDKPEYITVEEIDLPKIGGLISIPESVYRVEYETSLDPSIITDNASSTTVATVNVTELILTAIKDNDCKDLEITYSDNTTETLTDVICDIDVIASKTVTSTLDLTTSSITTTVTPTTVTPTTVTPTTVTPTTGDDSTDDTPVYTDTDRDGVPDEEDAFPNNPHETTNTSGHVYGDNFAEAIEDSEEVLDEIDQLIFDLTTIFTQGQIEDPDYNFAGGPGWFISQLAQRLNTNDGSINILKNSLPEEHPYYPEYSEPILEVEQEILDLINSCEFTPIPNPYHSPELVGDKVVLRINDGFYSDVTIIPIGGTTDYFFTANPDAPFATHKQFSFDENGIIQLWNNDGTFVDLVRQDSSEPYIVGGIQVGLQWDEDLFPTDVEFIDVYYKTRCGNIWKLTSSVTEYASDTPTEASNKRDTIDSWDHSYFYGDGRTYQLFNNPVYNP